jgi:predicted  nucleic acid-binding Zn-ribbon protein
MPDGKEADGILYRHFTIMNKELEHLQGLIDELDSKIKRLQQALESLEGKTSSEDSNLHAEIEKSTTQMTDLNKELRRDHETLSKNVTEIDGRLAERAGELSQLRARFDKELAPFTGTSEKFEPEAKPVIEVPPEAAKEQFIADLQASEDPKIEQIAEEIESEEERKKRKRK